MQNHPRNPQPTITKSMPRPGFKNHPVWVGKLQPWQHTPATYCQDSRGVAFRRAVQTCCLPRQLDDWRVPTELELVHLTWHNLPWCLGIHEGSWTVSLWLTYIPRYILKMLLAMKATDHPITSIFCSLYGPRQSG